MGYERAAQEQMLKLLELFGGHVTDRTLHDAVVEIVADRARWSEAHKQFVEVSACLLHAERSGRLPGKHKKQQQNAHHYLFLEHCLKTVYNESGVRPPFSAENPDLFDAISPFWVVPSAMQLAVELEIPLSEVHGCL